MHLRSHNLISLRALPICVHEYVFFVYVYSCINNMYTLVRFINNIRSYKCQLAFNSSLIYQHALYPLFHAWITIVLLDKNRECLCGPINDCGSSKFLLYHCTMLCGIGRYQALTRVIGTVFYSNCCCTDLTRCHTSGISFMTCRSSSLVILDVRQARFAALLSSRDIFLNSGVTLFDLMRLSNASLNNVISSLDKLSLSLSRSTVTSPSSFMVGQSESGDAQPGDGVSMGSDDPRAESCLYGLG